VAEITTKLDEPVHPVSACSVTNEAIAEIRRVDDSFYVRVCMRACVRVLPFWYRLTQVVLEKWPLNECNFVIY